MTEKHKKSVEKKSSKTKNFFIKKTDTFKNNCFQLRSKAIKCLVPIHADKNCLKQTVRFPCKN